MEAVETFSVGEDIEVRIIQDCDAESPREWDNLGIMACKHPRYNLGDEQIVCSGEEFMERLAIEADPETEEIKERVNQVLDYFYNGWDKPDRLATKIADKYLKDRIENSLDENYVILPLYLYDHSGLCMSTGRFSCPWDSGQVGWIYVKKDRVIAEFGKWDTDSIEQTKRCLEREVETYSQFLEGDVYGYEIYRKTEDGDEEFLDSCWGFFGFDFCKEEAKMVAGKYELDIEKSFVNYL